MSSKDYSISKKRMGIMPKGSVVLFFIQIFSTLSFSVLYSSLVLYMTHSLGISKNAANTITGVFLAFNYGLHLLGGFFGGRYLSNRALFAWGMLCQILGCLLISIPTQQSLYWGLAAFLTGSGLNVTCINCMLTQRFKPDDQEREAAFLWNYSGMNIGFFAGFSLSGYFQLLANYHQLFILSSLGNLVALTLLLYNWTTLADINTPLSRKTKKQQQQISLIGVMLVVLMIPALVLIIKSAQISNTLVIVIGISMVFVLFSLAMQQASVDARQKMLAFIALMFASLVFWTLYQIAPMGLTLFIKHNVDTKLFGMIIPPQWVQNINTIIIVIGGPILSMSFKRLRDNGYNINIPMQFAIALCLIGLGFVILPLGIKFANEFGLTHFNWVIISYVLQSVGELFISPIGYAMVGQLAPANLQGIMMGSWMMVTGVAATLSGYFSNMMVGVGSLYNPHLTNHSFSQTFNLLGWGALICAVILVVFTPKLRRLIAAEDTPMELTQMEVAR
jgi:proton-dependent oligopeptide transporter, POT family